MRPTTLAAAAAAALLGVGAGVGGFTFVYAKGGSYMTDDPRACANCHVMNEPFSGWIKSSHRAVAVCNDCHTPSGLLPKYLTKAKNGWHHSSAFTSGDFPDPIRITAGNLAITEQACRKCHRDIVAAIEGAAPGTLSCVRCHRSVGHLE